ncbi:MAG: hypothetical protein A2138_24420 [Deltaproteobacteria bacterium RBG_16_71_12]|nr:MAG: hypothetical protein A2138_24420 [Deltaproteobacteria bacterium RBG_16_71_12]
MKKLLAAVIASFALSMAACQSVESAKVDPATIASNGEAVAVVQCTALGLTAIFHFITITEASLDTVVNKMMVAEAKALGGNKVQLLGAMEMPKHGLIFMLAGGIVNLPPAMAMGIAVK